MADAPTLSSVLQSVRPLAEAGASLHWLWPFDHVSTDEKGLKTKRGKTPRASKWSEEPTLTFEQLRCAYRDRSNIGIRLGEPSKLFGYYLHLIDIDIRKAELAPEAWAALLLRFPDARDFPMVISGSRGESRHILFFSKVPFRKKTLARSKTQTVVWDEALKKHIAHHDWEIDLMGTGSQAVLPPSLHPDTGLPYIWEREIDLDLLEFGMGPIVPVELIETWGVREAVATEDDDDDLETLFNNSPLDLSEDEIDEILALIPNDAEETDAEGAVIRVGAHYDDYIEVGMALHHQYQGDEHGFQKWVEWASQSTKFDERHARYRWDRSFGGTKNPVRMATLIQKANSNRLAAEHDFDVDDDAFDAAPPAATGTALVPADRYSLDDLLGDAPSTSPAEAVVTPIEGPTLDPDWQSLFHRNEEGELKSTSHNVGLIVANDIRLRGVLAFNEFLQEIVVRCEPKRVKKKRESAKRAVNLTGSLWSNIDPINGNPFADPHEGAIRMLIEAPTTQGGYGIKVSDRDLRTAIEAAAHQWRFHPVKQKIEAVQWDGVRRMDRLFVEYLGAADTPYHRDTAVKTLVAAVARIYEPGHKFDYVPILEGVQGKRKSTFIETLAFGWFAELEGDLHDRKGMVEKMQGAWILEIPELQGFSKAEVTTIKGLVSARQDKVRMAYARRAVVFYRQCIFMGSTNEDEYLRDPTGGRRFWPIHCAIEGEIDILKLRHELPQIWAEALAEYRHLRTVHQGEALPLYLNTKDAADEALLLQSSRSQESSEQSLAGQIEAWLNEPIDDGTGFDDLDEDAPKVYRQETCLAQIWREMMGRQGVIPHMDAMKIGAALKATGWDRSSGPVQGLEINKKYGKTRVYSRPED